MNPNMIPATASECVPLLGAADHNDFEGDDFISDSSRPNNVGQVDRPTGKFSPKVFPVYSATSLVNK